MIISELLLKVKPLDLIFFTCNSIVSEIIKLAEEIDIGNAQWTHVGIVVSTDILPIKNGINGKLYIWESNISSTGIYNKIDTSASVLDIETEKGMFGVQIRDLEQVLRAYLSIEGSRVGWARLRKNPLDQDITTIYNTKCALLNLYNEYNHIPFEDNPFNLLGFIICCIRPYREQDDKHRKVVCSEFICIIYKRIGLIPMVINPRDVTPEDLASPLRSRELLPEINDQIIHITLS